MPPRSILAITSKIVSLCEGSVVPIKGTDREALIREQADYIMADQPDMAHGIRFTIKHGTLIPNSGIDVSNVAGEAYALWPRDPQTTANTVRKYLADRFGPEDRGVIITDSTCRPLRRGVSGEGIAFSGFMPLRSYIGKKDLFDKKFKVYADVVGGLASAAVLMMGEGAESTPLAMFEDVSQVEFVPRDPTDDELAQLKMPVETDLFSPFLTSVKWLPGGRSEK
jgi:F420-0:gamma-glutamyl ligase